jgi:ribonucleoside-diphosphate reductase alpha chain
MQEVEDYIHLSKYSRFLDLLSRREIWPETVKRFIDFWKKRYDGMGIDWDEIYLAILNKEVMPSMRALMTAGKALDKDNMAGFNCVAVAVTTPRVFDEIFYMLMCGSGAGFSVERQYITQMPEINYEMHRTDTTIVVADSKIGWARALKELIAMLYTGNIPNWDTSKVREAGARLKTFGGRASGPEPLEELFRYVVKMFKGAKGRKLNSIECHDLICKIAQTVIVGSVRRSACISFSNLTDDRMRRAKNGNFGEEHSERYLANNSVMYTEKPDMESFLKEFRNLLVSKSGERGIVYQKALVDKAVASGREWDGFYLLNPCAEAILRHTGQACNLSEIIARPGDTLKDLSRKARIAAFLGTLQSTLTDFRYVRKVWKDNAEQDRLLGVSLTGIMDHEIMSGLKGEDILAEWLIHLKKVVKGANIELSNLLGISYATQLTLVKPSGTVSQLVSCAAGMHPWMFRYILRKYAQDKKDPLSRLLIDQGVPYSEDEFKYYFHFPLKAPDNAICAEDIDAMYQLKLWKVYRDHWCDGNPSQTIYYDDSTFLKIQAWVWENFDSIGGLSFFPISDNVYKNNPFNEITKAEYEKMLSEFPKIDWSKLSDYEKSDETTGSQEFACAGGACEI